MTVSLRPWPRRDETTFTRTGGLRARVRQASHHAVLRHADQSVIPRDAERREGGRAQSWPIPHGEEGRTKANQARPRMLNGAGFRIPGRALASIAPVCPVGGCFA